MERSLEEFIARAKERFYNYCRKGKGHLDVQISRSHQDGSSECFEAHLGNDEAYCYRFSRSDWEVWLPFFIKHETSSFRKFLRGLKAVLEKTGYGSVALKLEKRKRKLEQIIEVTCSEKCEVFL